MVNLVRWGWVGGWMGGWVNLVRGRWVWEWVGELREMGVSVLNTCPALPALPCRALTLPIFSLRCAALFCSVSVLFCSVLIYYCPAREHTPCFK